MSYSLKTLKDNPVGFWKLNSAAVTADSSAGYWSAGSRTTNAATVTGTSTNVMPIVAGSSNAVKLANGQAVSIPNNYNMFYKGTEDKSFSIDFWIDFDSIPTSTTVFKTANSNLTLSFVDNVAVLSFLDDASNVYYAYSEIESYDSQLHVAIVYNNHSFNLYVNGVSSQSANLPTQRFFKDTTAQAFSFPGPASGYFLIDMIAFYTYPLSIEQIRNKIVWGLTDNNPQFYTLINNGGFINPDENSGVADSYFLYNDEKTWQLGRNVNCVIEGGNLTSRYIPDAEMYNPLQSPASPVYSSNGLSIATGTADSVRFKNFDSYINVASQSITAQLYVSTATTGTYFAITGFSFGQLIVEKTTATALRIYSPEGLLSGAISFSTLTNATWYNLVISFYGNRINATLSGTAGTAVTAPSNITLSNSTLYAGNSYIDTTGTGVLTTAPNTTNLVRNISVFDDADATALSDFTSYGKFTLSLNGSLSVSQNSFWEILIPACTTNTIIGNMALLGTSSSNIKLYGKAVGGSYSLQTVNGEKLPNTPIGATAAPMYVKVTIDTPVSSRFRPKLRYLEIVNYSNMTIHSVGKSFTISPYTATTYTHTYQFRQEKFNMLSRSRNFGIHCERDAAGGNAGVAIVTPSSAYKTVEFWFRINDATANATNTIVNNATSSLTYGTTLAPTATGWTAAYINGSTSLPANFVVGEIYHFVGTITAGSSANIYLNSSSTRTNTGECTFGEITLYGDEKNSTYVTNKYNKVLGVYPAQTVTDSVTITPTDSASVYAGNYSNLKISVQ